MKRVLAFVLALVMCLGLAACGGSTGSSTTPGSSAAGKPSASDSNGDKQDAGGNEVETPLGIDCSGDPVVTLRVSYIDPDNSICGQYVRDLEAQITEATQGTIQFDNFAGGSLYAAPDAVDGLLSGGCDMIWTPCNVFSGQFPIAEFCYLPLNGINSSRMACAVLNEMYRTMPEMQEEFEDFYVLMIGGCTVNPICTTEKKITCLDDVKGMTIRFAGSLSKQWANDVGFTPMTVSTPETYENLSKNIINGCANDWHNIIAFSLTDVLSYCMLFELSPAPFSVLLNKDAVNKLTDNQRAVLDMFADGYASQMAGFYWDSTRSACLTQMEQEGVEVYECPEDVYAAFTADEVKEDVNKAYIDYLNGCGLDGQAILAAANAVVEKYAATFENAWTDAPNAVQSDAGWAVEGWEPLTAK